LNLYSLNLEVEPVTNTLNLEPFTGGRLWGAWRNAGTPSWRAQETEGCTCTHK